MQLTKPENGLLDQAQTWLESFRYDDDGEFYLEPEDKEFFTMVIKHWLATTQGGKGSPRQVLMVLIDGIEFVPKL